MAGNCEGTGLFVFVWSVEIFIWQIFVFDL